MCSSCTTRVCAAWRPAVAGVLLLACTGLLLHGSQADGHVISGRVVDPLDLRPPDATLMLGWEEDGGFASMPVPLRPFRVTIWHGRFRLPLFSAAEPRSGGSPKSHPEPWPLTSASASFHV